jgi:hypothetical protein
LTAVEGRAAFVLADHGHHKSGEITISMETLAEEAELCSRQHASDVKGRLVEAGVFLEPRPSKGRMPSTLFLNYEVEHLQGPVTVAPLKPTNRTSGYAVNRTPSCAVENKRTAYGDAQNDAQPHTEMPQNSAKTGPTAYPGMQEGVKKEREPQEREQTGVCSKQKPTSKLLQRRDEVIGTFSDEFYLALLFQEAQLGILLTAEQIDRVLERLTTLKACGENPVLAISEVLRQVTAAVPTNGHGRNNKHLAGGNTGSAPVEHPELGSEAFVAFCAIYPPGKLDRKDALHSWCKGLCDDHAEEILAGVKSWKDDEQWKERRYIPFASSFLQKQRWKNAPLVEKSCTNYPELEVEA